MKHQRNYNDSTPPAVAAGYFVETSGFINAEKVQAHIILRSIAGNKENIMVHGGFVTCFCCHVYGFLHRHIAPAAMVERCRGILMIPSLPPKVKTALLGEKA